MKLPITSITIEGRIRNYFDPDYIAKLAESMRLVGLIEPIVLDEENKLIAGECRIRAAKSLGWTDITAVYLNDLDPWQKEVAEIEENLRRQNLTYVEELQAIEKWHLKHQDKFGKTSQMGGRKGGWKIADTAAHLGISVGAVSQDIQLAKAIRNDPELGKQKTKIAAKSMMNRKLTIKARQLMAVLTHTKQPRPTTGEGATGITGLTGDQFRALKVPALRRDIQLFLGDALELIPSLPDNSIHCLITDPPWQVAFDKEFGSDPQTGLVLTQKVLALLYPKLTEGALCWMFCATKHLIKGTIYNLVLSCGYRIYDQILIWYKPHVAHSSHPYRELKNDYEPALFFSKDEGRDLVSPMFAVQQATIKGNKLHKAQKPEEVLKTIILNSTVKGELIIDPFMGSGKVCKVAKDTGRRAIGIDKEQEAYDIAVGNIGGD